MLSLRTRESFKAVIHFFVYSVRTSLEELRWASRGSWFFPLSPNHYQQYLVNFSWTEHRLSVKEPCVFLYFHRSWLCAFIQWRLWISNMPMDGTDCYLRCSKNTGVGQLIFSQQFSLLSYLFHIHICCLQKILFQGLCLCVEEGDTETTKLISLGVRYCSPEEGILANVSKQDQHHYHAWERNFIQREKCTD